MVSQSRESLDLQETQWWMEVDYPAEAIAGVAGCSDLDDLGG
jgi:hypothetical protein